MRSTLALMAETTPSPSARRSESDQRFPWPLGLSLVGWFGMGGLLFAVGLGLTGRGGASEADSSSVGQVRESLGSSYVSSTGGGGSAVLMVIAGMVVTLLAVLLLVRQGWARHALSVAGVAVVILLAASGRWETVIAMVALVVGALPLLAPSATRYLAA